MQYEIEIKSLLGSPENAEALRASLVRVDPATALTSRNTQLNHYFTGGDTKTLAEKLSPLFSDPEQQKALHTILETGSNFSIRTREIDGRILLVVKASIDAHTSANGVSRLEFEEEVPGHTLDELDQAILAAGFSYQAKWSREREEYLCQGTKVCLDKNAGYGYLAEFERMADDMSEGDKIRGEIRALMQAVGLAELPQARLERMFAHYNQHWPEYYGTDKIFVIE